MRRLPDRRAGCSGGLLLARLRNGNRVAVNQKVEKRQRGGADESTPPGSAYAYIRSPPPTATIWPLM